MHCTVREYLLERNIGSWCCLGQPLVDRRDDLSSLLSTLAADEAGGGEHEREQRASHVFVISVLLSAKFSFDSSTPSLSATCISSSSWSPWPGWFVAQLMISFQGGRR
jgi:hypothetical protein